MLGIFADDLTVHLTLGRHVNNHVIEQLGVTAQTPPSVMGPYAR